MLDPPFTDIRQGIEETRRQNKRLGWDCQCLWLRLSSCLQFPSLFPRLRWNCSLQCLVFSLEGGCDSFTWFPLQLDWVSALREERERKKESGEENVCRNQGIVIPVVILHWVSHSEGFLEKKRRNRMRSKTHFSPLIPDLAVDALLIFEGESNDDVHGMNFMHIKFMRISFTPFQVNLFSFFHTKKCK